MTCHSLSSKALKHFLKCPVGEDGESIELAIETVRTVSLLKFSVLRCILRLCCFVLDQTTATSSAVAYRSHNSLMFYQNTIYLSEYFD